MLHDRDVEREVWPTADWLMFGGKLIGTTTRTTRRK